MDNEIIIICDCNHLCYINKFALSQGLTYRGNPTEIIFGFLRHLNELSRQFSNNKFIFCWDSRKSIRKEIYPSYKANRSINKSPEDRANDKIAYAQFNELKEYILPKMGFKNILHREGYESDDIIAAIVKNIPDRYVVVSSDSDLYQLLDYCSLYNISKKSLINKNLFIREYGITPDKWHIVRATSGCTTDNVSGVEGVKEKTAIKYLKGTLNAGAKYSAIKKSQDIVNRNLGLVTLPMEGVGEFGISWDEKFYEKTFISICEEFGFNSFLAPKYLNSWIDNFGMM